MNVRCLLWISFLLCLPALSRAATEEDGRVNVRVLKLSGAYSDRPAADDLGLFSFLTSGFERSRSFPEVIRRLDAWAQDTEVDHLALDLSDSPILTLGQASEMALHLGAFQAGGKRTFAWIGEATPSVYLVASACDQISMTDLSWLDFASPSLSVLHFHDLLRLVGAEASVVRAGEFKGAVEPFVRSEMSPELRQHYLELLQDMNHQSVALIAHHRGLSADEVRAAQGSRLFTARQAKAAGLIDRVIAPGEERSTIAQSVDQPVHWMEETARKQTKAPSLFDLLGKILAKPPRPAAAQPSLAVLHVQGQIMDDNTRFPGVVTPQQIAQAVAALEDDPNVKGVVVRVNSPGGSASASEAIRRSLERLAQAKRVLFSFGDVAASGGYWISCIERPIYAEPTTLTGSIGVFALKLSAADLMHTIGLNLETVSLDDSAQAMSMARAWTPAEEARVRTLIEEVNERFVQLVGTSRSLSPEQVQPLAGGRVWSGHQASERKLVDHLGGLEEALSELAEQTGLKGDYPVVHWPEQESLLDRLDLLGGGTLDALVNLKLLPSSFNPSAVRAIVQASVPGNPLRAWLLMPSQVRIQ